jgi:hypothetical protein
VADQFEKANHNPITVINGDRSKSTLTIPTKSGATVQLTAKDSSDPDGNTTRATWFLYPEAGTLRATAHLTNIRGMTTEFKIPSTDKSGTLHVILQIEDDGNPSLVSYRRVVLEVEP